eukprot:TRINITY_DN5089_c0_g2_i4.p1 TRINITY_DN5089_c0_g2~~TRINITY_DN5089_c0_g2_i4.p1  ORF type:complete len:204 (+),score=105.88 TRINITY_DN5089_c0_g2_i4:515-1126(+)
MVDNKLGGGVDSVDSSTPNNIQAYKDAHGVLAADKADNKYYLRSMASSGIGGQIEGAAKEKYLFDKAAAKACAKIYHIPNLTDWCPPTLLSQSRLANYYNQIALEAAIKDSPTSRFPNAIYIDDVSYNGTIITGLGDDSTEGYAYAATVVLSNVWNACGGQTGTKYTQCAQLTKDLQAVRALYPFHTWEDNKHGRTVGWPLTP